MIIVNMVLSIILDFIYKFKDLSFDNDKNIMCMI